MENFMDVQIIQSVSLQRKLIKDFSTDENIIEAIEEAIENLNIN